ncbi:hypothetical protein CRUP_002217 [Coryphaenoides rupestris]|nr:hypothetical protein CRUP_002217 [Coryphaenoides rupestris]
MDAATLTYDTLRFGEFEDFPETSEPRDDILSDVASRLWFTYRKNFQPIGGTGPTSDTGWGCMLRCGQMILGQALVCRHLGRDWQWAKDQQQRAAYAGLLNAFVDKKDSCYSIHQIAQMGVGEGKSIGQWYGPNTVAQRLCMPWLDYGGAACADPGGASALNGCLEGAGALAEEDGPLWRPLVLLIPLRLGLTDINEAYIETLKQCFMLPQSLGVIGGKPNSAHYFIGYVGEELIYLDPHTTQPAVEPGEDGQVPDDSYHCQHPPCRMHICELDPSIAATEDEFDDWCMRIRRVRNCSEHSVSFLHVFAWTFESSVNKNSTTQHFLWQLSCNRGSLPMFELVDSQPSHRVSVDVLNLTPDFSDSDRLERFFDSEDEEFEILSL